MLDAAEEVFTEQGYDGASIEEITRRAGIKRPLFYTYFGGKEGLYLACYRRARHTLDDQFTSAVKDAHLEPGLPDSLHAIVESLVRAYFDFLATAPGRWDMLYGPGAATAGPIAEEVTELRGRTVQLLASIIAQYSPTDSPKEMVLAYAHASSGAGEQLARWWRDTPGLPIDRLTELAVQYIWSGLSQLFTPPHV